MKKLFLFFALISSSLYAQVVINEFSAANYDEDDFQPGFGSYYSDWIELYNTGATAVDLTGYHLSDDLTDPMKWAFPTGTSIAAGDHLIILADSENGFSNGYYRTNFKLTQTKGTEYVVFSDVAGVVIESVQLNYPNKKNDSRGRTSDGATTWGVFDNPTPDATNTGSDDRYALTPLFDLMPGFYPGTITLTLSTTEPNSSIRYTNDGSNPNSTSTLYSGPITISTTSVIRAKTYSTDPNIASSHTETNTYFINESHTLKVISIAGGTSINTLLGGTQISPDGTLELFETDGTFLTESTGEFNKHGNDSWAYSQRGLDFISRDQYGINHALEDEIFDNKNRDEYQKVILKCGASDNYPFEGQANSNYAGEFGGAHIRDAYIQELSQLGDLRMDERSVEFAAMYVNGSYWGLYDIREKVDDHDFTKHYYDQDRNNLQYLKTWGGTWAEYGGIQAENDWDNLVDFITLNDMTIPANYAYVDSVFNTGSLIDYFILNGFVVNSDWLNWNTSWWRGIDPNGDKKKWRYSLWDMDATFNHYTNFSGTSNQSANADPCAPANLPNLGGQGHVPIWNALKENQDFFADYANRYAELSSSVFSCDSMHNLLDSMIAEIAGEMPAQINRWGGTLSEWQTNVDSLHAFIDTRCANVVTGLVNCDSSLSGPYQLTLLVDPPGSGEVQLSSITPSTYPFSATYFGGVDISLDADPFQCWEFDYWTIANDTLFPDNFTEMVNMTLDSDDTITVHFTPTNCIYVDVQPTGAGTVSINGSVVTSTSSLESVADSVNHTFDVTANPGFIFNNWDWDIHNPLPNNTSTNTIVYTYTNDTVIVNFNAVLMDTVVYIVNPPGAGTLDVDGTNYTVFPASDDYSQGVNSSLTATANTGFTFNSWSFNNNTPTPNTTSNNVSVTWSSNDTVYLNFDILPVDTVVYIVNPPGAGTLDVDGTNYTVFPASDDYSQGVNSSLTATANTGFTFNSWSFNSNTPTPNTTSNNVSVTWSSNDTVYLNFDIIPVDTIVYTINPPGAGSITIDGTPITTFPSTQIYSQGNNSSLSATPNAGFTFNNWDFDNNTANPNANSPNITITWISNDSVVVNFDIIPSYNVTYLTNPVGGGNIDIDGVNTTVFPTTISYLQGTNVTLEAFNNLNFTFENWESNSNAIIPNVNQSSVNFNVFADDTIVAVYDAFITDTLWVVTNPTGVAQLQIGPDVVTTSPFMGIYEVGEILNINATPSGSNIFNQWNLSNVGLPDYNANTYFIFNGQDTLFAYFNNVLSIADLGDDLSSIKVYPTVVNNELTIEINANEMTNMSIDLLNISGQKVQSLYQGEIATQNSFKRTFSIDVSSGVYLIQFNTGKTHVTHKIIKLR